jgi:two-component system, OmpR family, phosphate regulon sensor histidine kinase PhoR
LNLLKIHRSRSAIIVTLLAIALVASVLFARLSALAIERDRLEEARTALTAQAKLVRAAWEAHRDVDWDAFADARAQDAGVRISFIAGDGRVLGDSAIAPSQLGGLENHGNRPEVQSALTGELGFSVRDSASVTDRLAYVALPMNAGDVRVIRLAMPVSRMHGEVVRAEIVAVAFCGGAFFLALFALMQAERYRNDRIHHLEQALKRSAKDALALFQDDSAEADLARAIESAVDTQGQELGYRKAEVERQRHILQSMQEGVLVLDKRARIVFVNRSLREMLLMSNDVLERNALDVVRSSELQSLLERTQAEGSPQACELETEGIKPRRLLVQASPLGDASAGTVVVFVDVTEVRRLESLRRDFVANVSHELRTPVTAIRSAAETLRASALSDPKMALMFLDMVDRNAQRLGALVEDLLDLSRIESNTYKLNLERLSVGQVAQDCLSLFRERADKKNLKLLLDTSQELSEVESDKRALEQVLTNLIDNAVKYCPQGREISVRTSDHGDTVRISVRDTGPGIDAKHLPRLFERFYRVDPGRARDKGGTGLGLSIAKHLAEAMHASLSVESTPGEGTCFHLDMPKVVAEKVVAESQVA